MPTRCSRAVGTSASSGGFTGAPRSRCTYRASLAGSWSALPTETNLERGGYFVGPSKYAKHMGICAVTVDLNDARDLHSPEDALAVVLVSIEGILRSLDADDIAKTAD